MELLGLGQGDLGGGLAAHGLAAGLLNGDGVLPGGDQPGEGDAGVGNLLHGALLSLQGVDHQPLGVLAAGLTHPRNVQSAGLVGLGGELGDGEVVGGDGGAHGAHHAVGGDEDGVGLTGLEIFQGGGVLRDSLGVGVAVGAGGGESPALGGVSGEFPGQGGGVVADELGADVGDGYRRDGVAGGRGGAGELEIRRIGEGHGVLRVRLQPGESHGVTGEDAALHLSAGGTVGDCPLLGLRAVHHEGQIHFAGGDAVDGEAHDIGGGLGGGADGGDAGDGLPLQALHRDGILSAGGEVGEDVGLAGVGLAGDVAVGVGADHLKAVLCFLGLDGDGDGIGGALGGLHGVDGKGAGADEEEPHRSAGQSQHQHHGQHRGQPLGDFFALAGLVRTAVQGDVILLGLQGAGRRIILIDVLVDGLDEGVEHVVVRGEALLKGVVHLLGVGKLHRLHRLLGGLLVHGDVVGHNGRRDGGVAHLVALHVVHQCILELGGRLVAILGLEGAGLGDDAGHLVVGKHWRGQRLTGDAELVGGLGRGLLILQGGVVAVVDPVEDQTHGVEVDGLIDIGHELKELRGGVGAEHTLRH